ncbi:MAG: hypothetical protein Q9214_005254, partial [Letrouitia sp. 1 TL-2023]
MDGQNESWAYKIALSEILILQHPLVRREENIIDLHGVGWNVKIKDNGDYQLIPVLVYENASEYGNLYEFMIHSRPTIQRVTGKSAPLHQLYSFEQRLGLCIHIGKAIQVTHSC